MKSLIFLLIAASCALASNGFEVIQSETVSSKVVTGRSAEKVGELGSGIVRKLQKMSRSGFIGKNEMLSIEWLRFWNSLHVDFKLIGDEYSVTSRFNPFISVLGDGSNWENRKFHKSKSFLNSVLQIFPFVHLC